MQINILAIGRNMPKWIVQGYTTYAQRMPKQCRLNLIELPLCQRSKTLTTELIKQREAKSLLQALDPNSLTIALDVSGHAWSTDDFAHLLQEAIDNNQTLSLLIGGPDGLHETVLQQVSKQWSLSALTLPHSLVRIIIAEQCYRAWSILAHHPYHR